MAITRVSLSKFLKGTQDDINGPMEGVKRVRQLRAEVAAGIIAAGIFGGEEVQDEIIGELMERDPEFRRRRQALKEILTRAKDAGVEIRIADKGTDEPSEGAWAEDVAFDLMLEWGQTGFLLGLAVGMQLGPHAFDGGAR